MKNEHINLMISEKYLDKNNILIGCDLDYSQKITAPDGHELALIAYIPIKKILLEFPEILKHAKEQDIDTKSIYIFSYYDKDEYFLDYITEIDDAQQGYTKVIIAESEHFQFNLDNFYSLIPNKQSDGMTFFGGNPEFLQEESLDFHQEYIFLGQILGMDLPNNIEDIFYLTGNVGYIFIKKDLSDGLFFVQST